MVALQMGALVLALAQIRVLCRASVVHVVLRATASVVMTVCASRVAFGFKVICWLVSLCGALEPEICPPLLFQQLVRYSAVGCRITGDLVTVLLSLTQVVRTGTAELMNLLPAAWTNLKLHHAIALASIDQPYSSAGQARFTMMLVNLHVSCMWA